MRILSFFIETVQLFNKVLYYLFKIYNLNVNPGNYNIIYIILINNIYQQLFLKSGVIFKNKFVYIIRKIV